MAPLALRPLAGRCALHFIFFFVPRCRRFESQLVAPSVTFALAWIRARLSRPRNRSHPPPPLAGNQDSLLSPSLLRSLPDGTWLLLTVSSSHSKSGSQSDWDLTSTGQWHSPRLLIQTPLDLSSGFHLLLFSFFFLLLALLSPLSIYFPSLSLALPVYPLSTPPTRYLPVWISTSVSGFFLSDASFF